MDLLTQEQKDNFRRDGVLVIEDAINADELVRGEASGRVRCTPYEMELPAVPKATSFFAQQEGADMG